jgi:hypothetical protein
LRARFQDAGCGSNNREKTGWTVGCMGVLTITPFVESFALHGRQLRVFLEVGPFLSLIEERNL